MIAKFGLYATGSALIAVLSILIGACSATTTTTTTTVPSGSTQTESQVVEIGAAQSGQVTLSIGSGNITLGGGEADLMNAQFQFNVPEWRPEVTSALNGTTQSIEVRQPQSSVQVTGETVNEWNIRLNDVLPTALNASAGLGNVRIDASTLTLTDLDVNAGSGNIEVNLTGNWSASANLAFAVGAGNITLTVPNDVGVSIITSTVAGNVTANGLTQQDVAYINAVTGTSPVTLTITASAGSGNITLNVES